MIQEYVKNCRLESKNLVKYGADRDRAIVKAIMEHGALNTDQITALFFRTKTGRRKAEERLRALHEKGLIKYCRLSHDTPRIYYIDKLKGNPEHLISLNWAYIWHRSRLISGQSIYYWHKEIKYSMLQADALLAIKMPGGLKGENYKWYFIEMDRSNTSHNEFDKVKLYNELYDMHETLDLWWVEKASEFPKIQVITESERRKEVILEQVNNPKINTNGLKFDVILLTDIIKGAKVNG